MMSARERLNHSLKLIYWSALAASLVSLLGQALAAPLNLKIPLGVILFVPLGVFSHYLIRYLVRKYCVELDEYELFNYGMMFRLLCIATVMILALLDILLVPIA